MPLIKKCDVQEHFAARRRARSHGYIAPSQPAAADSSRAKANAAPSSRSAFAEDFSGEHASSVKSMAPNADKGREAL